jgi:P4 family phage/plasmid primase-like protien
MSETPISPGSSFDTLHRLHRWVGWRWEVRKGTKTKPPRAPGSGRYASVSDPRTWGSHAEAQAMPDVDGIGIVLTGHPNIAACDLDHCRDPSTGALTAWAQALIEQAGSYAEITPSRAGLRIVGLAQTGEQHFVIPKGANGEKIEVYAGGASRFITVTDDVLVDRPLADITPIVESLIAENAGAKAGAQDPGADGEDLAGLSAEVADLVRDGAPAGADRSQMLFRAIAAMRAAGWPRARIIATLRAHPAGIAAKCFDTGRDDVARQVDMVLKKVDDEHATRRTRARRAAPGATAQAAEQPASAVGEDALALLFAEQNEGHFVFDHTRGQWFRWDGQIWRPDADEYVLDCTRALIRSHKLGRIRTATSIERAARTDRRLARNHTSWNADLYLLGTPGDVVDLRDGELLAADAAYMVNLSAGVRPAPQGTPHPLWSQFLSEATCNDADLQRYLKQRAGYWLTGDTRLEDFDFFYGPGGNGKGVFLKTIAAIMGDYALVAPISQFMVSRHDEHLCELARLAYARLVIASEPEENRTWAVGKIKQLTGNEGRIAARHMHQNFFEFWPRFKLVFVGNTKPRIASVDEALVRRLNLVPFQYQPATRDEQLKEKLVVEYPAILRWAIDGWLDLQANGRIRPAIITAATREYLDDENAIAAWLAERCELGPLHEVTLKGLFADWKTWCEATGEDPETNRKLKRRLEKLPGLRFAHGKHGVSVKGIRVKP